MGNRWCQWRKKKHFLGATLTKILLLSSKKKVMKISSHHFFMFFVVMFMWISSRSRRPLFGILPNHGGFSDVVAVPQFFCWSSYKKCQVKQGRRSNGKFPQHLVGLSWKPVLFQSLQKVLLCPKMPTFHISQGIRLRLFLHQQAGYSFNPWTRLDIHFFGDKLKVENVSCGSLQSETTASNRDPFEGTLRKANIEKRWKKANVVLFIKKIL